MRKREKSKGGLIFSAILLALFGLALVFVLYWENHILPQTLQAEETVQPEEIQEASEEPAETVSEQTEDVETAEDVEDTENAMPTLPEDALNGKETLRILLTGQDRREEDGWGRSDTMILCTIDSRTNTVTMVSFLRDLYVQIPGHSSSRLNSAYSWGGTELLNQTLEENFGVQIDGNIEIDFYGFMNMIDYLGGVDLELTAEEAEYLNRNGNWDVEENAAWSLKQGLNHLDGSQTLAYSRIRYLDSDFVRTERQRKVLLELMEKLQALSWEELVEAMDALLDQSTISLTEEEMLLYTLGFYPVLMDCEVVTQQIPAEGTYSFETIRGMSVIDADLAENREILEELLPE